MLIHIYFLQDLQKYLDNSPHGVVYFSLGSVVRCSKLSIALKKVIFSTLSELPYNILLKWELDDLSINTNNIFAKEWFPQQDVLAHKNVKVFVSQVGLQSMEEAIHREVPVVGIPFLGDQPLNALKVEKLNIGVILDHNTITKEQLKNAILSVAQNSKLVPF